ncbi:Cytidine deaminase [Weissella confusa]|nr:Cytidine deaminase [Weissella confusa]
MYTGVSIDSSSSLGFCAEHGAIADMIQHNESRVVRCVAVHYSGKIYAPCGRCRQFFYNINPDNLATEFLLPDNKTTDLATLLPYIN